MNRQECASQHFGLWMCEPLWLDHAVEAVRSGAWEPMEDASYEDEGNESFNREIQDAEVDDRGYVYYVTDTAGIATIFVQGHLTKHRSSFGGTSLIDLRKAVVRADADPNVRGIMLHVDSPGGTIAGTFDAARSVASTKTPIHTYAEDLMASAALLIGTQADHVSANQAAMVGSIGVVTKVIDWSGQYEERGAKVYVVSTGKYKGLGIRGSEVTEEHIEYLQDRVDTENDLFVAAVAAGRNMAEDDVRALATGAVWVDEDAVEVGLVDEIESLDDAYARLEAAISGASYSTPNREDQSMFGRDKTDKDTAAESEDSVMQRLDAIGEAFEEFGAHADTLANRAFRAGLDADQAEHMAGGIRQVLAAQDSDADELRTELSAAQDRVGELEAETEGLKKRLGEGNEAVDDGPGQDAGPSAEQFEAAVKEKMEADEDLSRGQAIGAVRTEDPKLYEAWHIAQQG